MTQITVDAAEKLKRLIAEKNKDTAIPKTAGVRLSAQNNGISELKYKLEVERAPRDNDAVHESNGIRFFVDHASDLKNALVYLEKNGLTEIFAVEIPNAKR